MKKDIMNLFNLKGVIVDRMEIKKEILIYVRSPRTQARCPLCGRLSDKLHQRRERRVVHGIFNNKKTVLVVRKRRFKCLNCLRPFSEPNIEGVNRRRFSRLFQLAAIEELKNRSFKSVSESHQVSSPALLDFLKEKKKEPFWPDKGEIILNLDEHSFGGRNLKITVGDAKRKRLMAVLKDDRQKTLKRFLQNIPDGSKSRISEICIDMKQSYRVAIEEELPGVRIVIDQFHIIRELLRQMDETRKILQEKGDKGQRRINRFLLLKNRENLNVVERLKLEQIFKAYEKFPTLKHCYLIKERMREIYRGHNYNVAAHKLDVLIKALDNIPVGKLKEIRETLKRWRPYILNFFHNRTTNAFIEGLHNKIKLTKRISYGFRNFDNYVLKITLACLPFLFLYEKFAH